MMDFIKKRWISQVFMKENDESFIKSDEFCIKSDELCIMDG